LSRAGTAELKSDEAPSGAGLSLAGVRYRLYRLDPAQARDLAAPPPDAHTGSRILRARERRLPPFIGIQPIGGRLQTARLWLRHRRGGFDTDELAIVVVSVDGRVGHLSSVLPSCRQFRFMGRDDLQIAATYTAPAFRGRGLARIGAATIVHAFARAGRAFHYLVTDDNRPSIRVAESLGFRAVGTVTKRRARAPPWRSVYERDPD
jgi:GNAT superfamily N-acetyltransferase